MERDYFDDSMGYSILRKVAVNVTEQNKINIKYLVSFYLIPLI